MIRRIEIVLNMTATVLVLFAAVVAAQMPQTTAEKAAGSPTTTAQQINGEVVFVEGNDLVVKLSTGEIRTFKVLESRRFIIDGKELSVNELKVGTKLTATITTIATPIMVRTTTVGSGKVWYVAGNNVILTLPNGENRQYKVDDDYKFSIEGRPATVFELRKGMTVSAQKIVEEPRTEMTTDTRIVGQAPPPPPQAAPKAAAAPAPAPVKPAEVAPPAPAPIPVALAEPAPVAAPASATAAAPAKAKLPKTASSLPLMGVLGLLLVGGSFGIRMLRQL